MIGRLRTEKDLARFVKKQVDKPDVVPAPPPPIAIMKPGVPADTDFPQTPGDGLFGLNIENPEEPILYVRVAGAWREI